MTYLFGYRGRTIEEIAEAITGQLKTTPELREKAAGGGTYWLFRRGNERAVLQSNRNEGPEAEPAEVDFATWPVLLYLETERRPSAMRAAIRECRIQPTFLRASKY